VALPGDAAIDRHSIDRPEAFRRLRLILAAFVGRI